MNKLPDSPRTDAELGRNAIIRELGRLRYSGSLMTFQPRLEQATNEVEFNLALVDWITTFNRILTNVSDTTTNMAAELTDLRNQRKAVRDFLGLAATQGETQ